MSDVQEIPWHEEGYPDTVLRVGDEVWDFLTSGYAKVLRIESNANQTEGIWLDNEYVGGGRHPWEISTLRAKTVKVADVSKPIDPILARRGTLFSLVCDELDNAYAKHGGEQWGRHEFYGVLKEEVDELWDAIKHDEPMEKVYAELIQVAAMCFRYYETRDRYQEAPTHRGFRPEVVR